MSSPEGGNLGGASASEGSLAEDYKTTIHCSPGTQTSLGSAILDPGSLYFYCSPGLHKKSSRTIVWMLGCCPRNPDAVRGVGGICVRLLKQRVPGCGACLLLSLWKGQGDLLDPEIVMVGGGAWIQLSSTPLMSPSGPGSPKVSVLGPDAWIREPYDFIGHLVST